MQKFGEVTFKHPDDDRHLFVVWTEITPGFERIDLLERFEDYSQVDSSKAVAAYFKKTKDQVLGDEVLITRFLKARSLAATFKAVTKTEASVVQGKIAVLSSKQNESLGLYYSICTLNGITSEEIIETPDVSIAIHEVSAQKGLDNVPINIAAYMGYGIFDGVILDDSSDAEFYPLSYLLSRYPMLSHIENMDFVVVGSMEQAEQRLQRWIDSPEKLKAIDLETTGLDNSIYGQDVITGIVMSFSEQESTYYPFRQENFDFNLPESFMQKIIDAVNDQPEDVLILAHNGKYETEGVMKEEPLFLKHSDYAVDWHKAHFPNDMFGLERAFVRIDADSYLLSTLVNPVMGKGLHTLKGLVARATGRFYLELDMIFKGKIKFNVLPPDIVRYYACPDTPNTITVFKWLLTQLPEDETGITKIEYNLLKVKAEQEFYGLPGDMEKLAEYKMVEKQKVEKLGNIFRGYHKIAGNINSPDIRRDIIYNRLRCPIEVRTNTGKASTSAIAIKRIVELGTLKGVEKEVPTPPIVDMNNKVIIKSSELDSNRYPSLVVLSKYNKATKELGALERLLRKSRKDRIMFNINQTGAGSGRQTSDAHQFSDTMKEVVVADSPDHHLCSCDYKQVELRVLAFLAGQLDLIELQKDAEVDIHRAILSIINRLPMWQITAKMRKEGKSVNFGVVYMMSEYGLARKNAGPAYTNEDLLKALKSITDFYNGLPAIKQFVHDNGEYVKEHGYIKTLFGRYRHFKEILDPLTPPKRVQSMVRAANNTPVQGFAADMMKQVEVNIYNYIRNKGWNKLVECSNGAWLPMVRLMLSIHDECLISSHKSIPVEEIILMLKICMEIDIKGAPPFFASPAFIENWYLGKQDKYEIPIPFRDEILRKYEATGELTFDMSFYEDEEGKRQSRYVDTINQHRLQVLSEYMDGLIQQYKTLDEVADHVRHDTLTHTLISTFIDDDEVKKFDHLEAIRIATERYMTGVHNIAILHSSDDVDVIGDEDERSDSFEDLEKYLPVDNNGELIVDETEEEEDDMSTVYNLDMSRNFKPAERSYVMYTMDEALIDYTGINIAVEGEDIHKVIAGYNDPTAFYKVVYYINGKLVPTGMRMGYHADVINGAIRDIVGGETFNVG